MGEPSKELLDLPSEPRPPAFFIGAPPPPPPPPRLLLLLLSLAFDSSNPFPRFLPSPLDDGWVRVVRRVASRWQRPAATATAKAGAQGGQQAGASHRPPPQEPRLLGRVKDFLGEMAKANEKLQLDAKNKPPEEYDIEALTGNEKEYIEMDLLLGVAHLHSEQAVEAAEAAMTGFPPSGKSFTSGSSDSEDDSDDTDEDGGVEPIALDKDKCKGPAKPNTEMVTTQEKKPNKRQKIVVLD
ncbi:hypothetical protein ACP4OV_027621 [Aristida adscensionis]